MKGGVILTKGASSLWKTLVNTENDYICLSVTKRLQYMNAQFTKNLHIQRRFAIQRLTQSPQLSVVTTGTATAKTNQKSRPETSVLIARGIHGEGAGRGVPAGTGSPLPNAGGIRGLSQTSAKAQQQHQLKPVDNLEADVPDTVFSGMNTEFPCVTRNRIAGPEPEYHRIASGFHIYHHQEPFPLKWNGAVMPEAKVAYETWGELNEEGSNAVLICAGLSASSHAKSHPGNDKPGWWEKFVGPGCAVDTNKFFVICTNTLGSCYGTSGPSSINPLTNKSYGTTFPLISIEDMVRTQFLVLDHLGIDKLHASVGSSLGGMSSLMASAMFPERVGRMVSISSCARSHPSSIAMRYLQRKTIMTDPNWNKGHYYEGAFPKMGMKLAREIATLTYRSGPEWDERFGRQRMDEMASPSLCPTFLIESYLEYQGESFSNKFDPNSILYISKAMDLFDIADGYGSLEKGLSEITCPVMVIGVQTDILFPIWQQRELAKVLQDTGNNSVTFYELNSLYGHDTFLLDLNGVGAGVKGFLETEMNEECRVTNRKTEPKRDNHNKDRRFF